MRQAAARADTLPLELQALGARIEQLHERLKKGDPDLTPDGLQVAIERVEAKRRELHDVRPAGRETARVLVMR